MPNDVREKLANAVYFNVPANYDGSNQDEVIVVMEKCADAILAVIGAEIEGMKEIYPHEETCRCKECVGVYYKNKTLTDLRARLEGK